MIPCQSGKFDCGRLRTTRPALFDPMLRVACQPAGTAKIFAETVGRSSKRPSVPEVIRLALPDNGCPHLPKSKDPLRGRNSKLFKSGVGFTHRSRPRMSRPK